jgi:periplasmic protein TonB
MRLQTAVAASMVLMAAGTAASPLREDTAELPGVSEQAPAGPEKKEWYQQLQAHILAFARYPKAKVKKRSRGSVHVAFVVDRSGYVLRSALVQSSKVAAFDHAALAAVENAQPLPAPPATIEGEKFAVSIIINFEPGPRL